MQPRSLRKPLALPTAAAPAPSSGNGTPLSSPPPAASSVDNRATMSPKPSTQSAPVPVAFAPVKPTGKATQETKKKSLAELLAAKDAASTGGGGVVGATPSSPPSPPAAPAPLSKAASRQTALTLNLPSQPPSSSSSFAAPASTSSIPPGTGGKRQGSGHSSPAPSASPTVTPPTSALSRRKPGASVSHADPNLNSNPPAASKSAEGTGGGANLTDVSTHSSPSSPYTSTIAAHRTRGGGGGTNTTPPPLPLASSPPGEEKKTTPTPPPAAEAESPALPKGAGVNPSDIQSNPISAEPLSFAPRPQPETGEVLVQGVLGAIRQRLLTEMIDHVEEVYKILICDRSGAEILNSCFRMHELMEHDVIVVEDLAVARQPVLSSPAMYFLSPQNEEGITHMLEDWSSRPRYKQAHVFWTSRVSDEVLERLAEEKVFAKRIVTMKDMMLDFSCTETLLFHLNTKIDLWRLFPAVGKPLWLHDEHYDMAVAKMVEVLHTLNSGMPIIRYQQTSTPARDFSTQLISQIKPLSGSSALSPGCLHRPLLIVVDRCCDFFEGLVHHRTYQCLSDEMCPLRNGVYEQTYQGRKGEELKRTMMIDERDEYWCRFRHESFDRCLRIFQEELKSLLASNPSLAHGAQKGLGLAAAGSAMRALPDFLDRQAKLSAHIDICTTITQQYAKQQLQGIIDLELDLLLHRRSTKELLKQVKMVGGDLSVPSALRVRALTLCFAFLSEKDLTHDQRLHLISTCGLQEEMAPVLSGIRLVSERISKEQMGKLGRNYQSAAEEDAVGGSPAVSSPSSDTVGAGKGLLNYPSYAKVILTAALQDSLNKNEFPFVNDEASSAAQQYMRKGGKAAAHHASLRLHAGRAKAGAGASVTSGGKESLPLLDLGHEGKYVLKAPQKIILFVLGGVTSGEARAAYELAKEYGREILIGGTHLLDPKEIIEEVKLCGTDGTPSVAGPAPPSPPASPLSYDAASY